MKRLRPVLAAVAGMAALFCLFSAAWIPAKAALAQRLLERAWTQALAGREQPRPWPWADTFPVARLSAPRQGIDLIVLSGASGRTLAFGPGYLQGSAAPGAQGLTVIAAHRDTHFAFLRHLLPGDALRLQTPDGRSREFVVEDIRVVNSRRTGIDLDAPGAALMLVTCYPFDAVAAGGPLRFQVVARQVRT
jgi:sortase A